jgi:hypothetical protein
MESITVLLYHCHGLSDFIAGQYKVSVVPTISYLRLYSKKQQLEELSEYPATKS